jgi:signal peptidase I
LAVVGVLGLVVVRVFVATIVEVEGHAMSPNLENEDRIFVRRGAWMIAPGDAVVFRPPPDLLTRSGFAPPPASVPPQGQPPLAMSVTSGQPLPSAWLDRSALAARWSHLQGESEDPKGHWWMGRVLARPGDVVVFGDPAAKGGIIVNGAILHDVADPQADNPKLPSRKIVLGDRVVSVQGSTLRFDIARLVPAGTKLPVAIEAPGFLVLADDRDRGQCCDSRKLGWVDASAVKGAVLGRLRFNAWANGGRIWAWNP